MSRLLSLALDAGIHAFVMTGVWCALDVVMGRPIDADRAIVVFAVAAAGYMVGAEAVSA